MSYIKSAFPIVVATLLCACGNNGQGEYGGQAYPVITVQPDSITVEEYYSASIQGRQDVEIYPQVTGTITKVCVKEGARVSKGDVLFIIDQVPYKAALLEAQANVHAAQAQVETAQLEYTSKEALHRGNVISEYEVSMARNTLSSAKAGLEQARAQEIAARNNLSYTEVRSPSDGVVGTIPYREGALVSSTISSPLTTVSNNREMYVYFSMTENQLRALLRQYGTPDEVIARMPSIRLQLNDGSLYASDGRIETISGVINPTTGTVSVRAVFPNESNILLSGGIGNVIIPRHERSALVIPQSVTYEIQDKLFAYKLVKGRAVATELTVEKIHDGKQYIVRNGLQRGDTIVSEGVGLIQDGMEIAVKTVAEAGAPEQQNR